MSDDALADNYRYKGESIKERKEHCEGKKDSLRHVRPKGFSKLLSDFHFGFGRE